MDEARAWNYCLWLLGRRAWTEAELRERMRRKEASAAVVEAVVARLREYGFLDDRAFAESFVRSRSREHGSARLRGDLLRKGVAEEIVAGELAGLDEAAQVAAARELLRRHAWRFERSGEEPQRRRARIWGFLARRGFPPDVAGAVLEEFLRSAGEAED